MEQLIQMENVISGSDRRSLFGFFSPRIPSLISNVFFLSFYFLYNSWSQLMHDFRRHLEEVRR